MPTSIFVLPTIIPVLLTLHLCAADLPSPSGPSGPGSSGPSLPNPPGYNCAFQPPSGCGPDTTTPAYNDCLVRDASVSEFIQCAGETSTIGSDDDDQQPLNALDVLVSAIKIPACNKCKSRTAFTDYQSMKDKNVKLANYLCGKVDDSDICCLSDCTGARQPEHSLKGICKNDDVNLWDNDPINCGGSGDSDDGEGGGSGGGEGGKDGDDDDDQTTASSSATVADASRQTVAPSTSSNTSAQTTLPIQTATSSPAGSLSPAPSPSSTSTSTSTSTSSAGSSIRSANIKALGFLVVILTAGIGGAI